MSLGYCAKTMTIFSLAAPAYKLYYIQSCQAILKWSAVRIAFLIYKTVGNISTIYIHIFELRCFSLTSAFKCFKII